MKKASLILFILVNTISISFGQETDQLFSIRIGYSSTSIVFKEAVEPSFQFFGNTFKAGKTFVGSGPEFGISKSVNDKLFIDLGLSSFSGNEIKTEVNGNKNYYNLRGLQIPLTVNYLFRDSSRKLRISVGAGFQLLNGRLKQFEDITTGGGQTTYQLTDFDISEFQFAIRPGIQIRIIPNLFALFIVKLSISTNGRYSDNPCLSVKYTFNKAK